MLTLGVSGLALANNGTGDKEKEPAKKEVADKLMDCLVVEITPVDGLCGGRTYRDVSHISENCGETEGGIIFQLQPTEQVDDCNWDDILPSDDGVTI